MRDKFAKSNVDQLAAYYVILGRRTVNHSDIFSLTVNSTGSGSSTKYDPDLLKADVALAKNRVARLRRDLEVARAEFAYQQRGIDMLSQ